MNDVVRITANSTEQNAAVIAFSVPSPLPDVESGAALPDSFVWMPAGRHAICAGTMDGTGFNGEVVCDEQAARSVMSSFDRIKSSGGRVWLDLNHDDAAASAWVKAFSWDPNRGIICHVEWTPRGEAALRGKEYFSFSPAFEAQASTGRVFGLIAGHAAGGLVNAPAFGRAMPALIAARLGSGKPNTTASGGNPEQSNMKDILIKLLAALKVQTPADATEETLVSLLASQMKPADVSSIASAVQAAKSEVEKLVGELDTIRVAAKASTDKSTELEKTIGELKAVVAAVGARKSVDVTSSDLTDVLAAYAAKDPSQIPASGDRNIALREELALERAAIYAREVKPRLQNNRDRSAIRAALADLLVHARSRGSDIARIAAKASDNRLVLAANSLGTLSGSLITQNSLSLLKADLPAMGSFTTDFSNASAKLNQTVITRVRSLPAVQSYNPGAGGYASTSVTDTDVPVTIDQHRYVQFEYNASELGATNRDLFGEQAEGAVYSLGKDVVDFVLALVTLANFNLVAQKSVVAQASWNRAAVIQQRVALRNRKVQIKDGFAIMNEDYFGQLAQDSAIVSLATYQRPELISEYILPKIAGFTPVGYVDLPNTGNLVAVLGAKESLVAAARLPYDYVDAQVGANYGTVSQITDPDTGLSVMLTQYVNHDAGASKYRVALMYGAAVGDKTRAQLVVSA